MHLSGNLNTSVSYYKIDKTMKSKILKYGLIIGVVGALLGGGVGLYMFNMPHRDVQSSNVDFEMSSSDLVQEYLADLNVANGKYLQEEGDSKILAITGKVSNITKNMQGNFVVLLKADNAPAGVNCTFTTATNDHAQTIKLGQTVTIKGVIRSGAGFDEDLELYEDVILEKSDVL